jgi:hypothetical protein
MPNEVLSFIQDLMDNKLNYCCEVNSDEKNEHTASSLQAENLVGFIKKSQINEIYTRCSQSELGNIFVDKVKDLTGFVHNKMGTTSQADRDLMLNDDLFTRSLNLMDLVTVNSTRTSCFTKKLV